MYTYRIHNQTVRCRGLEWVKLIGTDDEVWKGIQSQTVVVRPVDWTHM